MPQNVPPKKPDEEPRVPLTFMLLGGMLGWGAPMTVVMMLFERWEDGVWPTASRWVFAVITFGIAGGCVAGYVNWWIEDRLARRRSQG